jgi:hypothetical protein
VLEACRAQATYGKEDHVTRTAYEDPQVIRPNELIGKIDNTFLGYEDHGILTVLLRVTYGSSSQGVGGYVIDAYDKTLERRVPTVHCGRWVAGILAACGVDSWEKVRGRTVVVIREGEGWNGRPIGIRPLPTEGGAPFYFDDGDRVEIHLNKNLELPDKEPSA